MKRGRRAGVGPPQGAFLQLSQPIPEGACVLLGTAVDVIVTRGVVITAELSFFFLSLPCQPALKVLLGIFAGRVRRALGLGLLCYCRLSLLPYGQLQTGFPGGLLVLTAQHWFTKSAVKFNFKSGMLRMLEDMHPCLNARMHIDIHGLTCTRAI